MNPFAALRNGFGGAVLGAVLASCASPAPKVGAITATDTRCVVPSSRIRAGANEIRVRNRGREVTEVYVYSASGQVEGEIPDVARGATRSLAMDLAPGDYHIVCKSGTNTKGIRTTISVTGSGGPHRTRPDATIDVSATDYRYHGLRGRVIAAGTTVAIRMKNDAPIETHELEVFGPDGQAVGEIGPTAPGRTGIVVLTFDQTGTYEFVCGVEDHAEEGMTGRFRVR